VQPSLIKAKQINKGKVVKMSITFEKGKSTAINDVMEHFNYNKPMLGGPAKLRKAAISFVMSVRPSILPTTRLPLDGFS
jgi:hypothetical protein